MKKSQFSDEQIINVLREAQGPTPIKDVCAKHNISEPTFYKWRAKFGGMDLNEMRRLQHSPRGREQPIRRTRAPVADLTNSEPRILQKR